MRVLEKIPAEKLKLFIKKSKCFIAKDKEVKLQYSIAAEQCMKLNEMLQHKRQKNSERHTGKKIITKYKRLNCISMLHVNPQGTSGYIFADRVPKQESGESYFCQ